MPTPLEFPDPLRDALDPLMTMLPLEQAMPELVSPQPLTGEARDEVARLVELPLIAHMPGLVAGLWLYVDDLDRSHTVSQAISEPYGSYWHGIMHRREGDFSNSHYWFRQTGAHSAIIQLGDAYDPHVLIDDVAADHEAGGPADPTLVELQRREWKNLMAWCAMEADRREASS